MYVVYVRSTEVLMSVIICNIILRTPYSIPTYINTTQHIQYLNSLHLTCSSELPGLPQGSAGKQTGKLPCHS